MKDPNHTLHFRRALQTWLYGLGIRYGFNSLFCHFLFTDMEMSHQSVRNIIESSTGDMFHALAYHMKLWQQECISSLRFSFCYWMTLFTHFESQASPPTIGSKCKQEHRKQPSIVFCLTYSVAPIQFPVFLHQVFETNMELQQSPYTRITAVLLPLPR